MYVQGGKVIQNNIQTAWDGSKDKEYYSLDADYCTNVAHEDEYDKRGGNGAFTKSFQRGQVLALSIWTDGSMSWLDSGDAGPCASNPGKDNLVSQNKSAYVEYSNIKFGDIDSTY